MKNKGFNDDIWDETEKQTVQMEAKNRAKSYMNSAEIVFKTKSRSAAFAISGVIKAALGGESFQSVVEDSLDNNSTYFAKRLLKDPDINEIREFEACTLGSGMNPDALAYTISKKVA